MTEKQATKANNHVLYEVAYHLVPLVEESAVDVEVGKIRSLVVDNGAKVVAEESARRFSLSYPIGRRTKGKQEFFDTSYFGWVRFEADAESAQKIKVGVGEIDSVLRHIIVKTEPDAGVATVRQKPRSIMSKSKSTEASNKQKPVSKEELDKEIERLVVE